MRWEGVTGHKIVHTAWEEPWHQQSLPRSTDKAQWEQTLSPQLLSKSANHDREVALGESKELLNGKRRLVWFLDTDCPAHSPASIKSLRAFRPRRRPWKAQQNHWRQSRRKSKPSYEQRDGDKTWKRHWLWCYPTSLFINSRWGS